MNNFEKRLALIEAVLAGDMTVEEARRRRVEMERISDHLRRDGWSEFTVQEVFDAIDDEFEIDPESGAS